LTAAAGGDSRWLLLAVVANGTILVLTTAQWLLFLPRGAHVPATRMFGIVAVTSSVSNGGPMLAGHATGVHLLATRGRLGHAAGVSVTILDQLAEGMAKIIIVAAATMVVPGFQRRAGVVLIVLVPALIAVFALLAHRRHLLEAFASQRTGRAGSVL